MKGLLAKETRVAPGLWVPSCPPLFGELKQLLTMASPLNLLSQFEDAATFNTMAQVRYGVRGQEGAAVASPGVGG